MQKQIESHKEREMLEELEHTDFEVIKDAKALQTLTKASITTVEKRKAISIKLLESDLKRLKSKAINEGMPYQTLIGSVLHKYLNGELVSKA